MRSTKRQLCLLDLVSLAVAALACTISGGGAATATPPVILSATLAPDISLTGQPTTVLQQTATIPAQATDFPTTIPTSEPVRVRFATGATQVTFTGSIPDQGLDTYLLYALAGQTMTVKVEAMGGKVGLTIVSPLGSPLVRSMFGLTEWSGPLPETGDYTIQILSLAGAADYTLDITIPPLASSEPCTFTLKQSLTAYKEAWSSASVFGTAQPGDSFYALARTLDGWLGFDPGVAQAGNVGRARLRWLLPAKDGSDLEYGVMPSCQQLPLVMSVDQILNGSYTSLNATGGPFKLTNGEYLDTSDPNAPLTIGLFAWAFGDMNGDGAEDAVVALATNTGGTGNFVDLDVAINQGGHPVHLSSVFIDDRPIVRGLFIDGGILIADLTVHDAGDSGCCPTLEVTWRFQLVGNQLTRIE